MNAAEASSTSTTSPDTSTTRRGGSSPATRQNSEPATVANQSQQSSQVNNIWDSAWAAINQTPPPGLNEVLNAYSKQGDNDREMLLRILQAKSAEDERLASIASLHRTILELQSAALAAQSQTIAASFGSRSPRSTPSPPSTGQQHLQAPPQLSSSSSASSHDPSRRQPPTQHSPRAYTGTSPSQQYAAYPQYHPYPPQSTSSKTTTLPPISTMDGRSAAASSAYGEPPRKRSRPSPPETATSSSGPIPERRTSPEYPLSPYIATGHGGHGRQSSIGGGGDRGYANGSGNGWTTTTTTPAQTNGHSRGRVSVSSLLGNNENEDVDYRRMQQSSERNSR